MFLSRNKKIMYTAVNPSFTIQNWGLRGSKLYMHVFMMYIFCSGDVFFVEDKIKNLGLLGKCVIVYAHGCRQSSGLSLPRKHFMKGNALIQCYFPWTGHKNSSTI